jgi:hypothetical protein
MWVTRLMLGWKFEKWYAIAERANPLDVETLNEEVHHDARLSDRTADALKYYTDHTQLIAINRLIRLFIISPAVILQDVRSKLLTLMSNRAYRTIP